LNLLTKSGGIEMHNKINNKTENKLFNF
jgi:hypothetical protein